MEIKIEYAVCCDCDNEIGELEFAIKGADGDILCERCMKKFLDGDFADALEWTQTAEVANGARFSRKTIGESRVVYPRGRDIA